MGVVVFALVNVLDPWFAPQSGLIAQGMALIVLVAAGLLTYLGAAICSARPSSAICSRTPDPKGLAKGGGRAMLQCNIALQQREVVPVQGRPRRSVLICPARMTGPWRKPKPSRPTL